MSESRPPVQLCEDESTLFGQFSRMYFTGLAALPWRTQLISGALPLNLHVRPLVTSLSGPRRTELQALLWPHIVHRYNVIFIDNPIFAPDPPPNYQNTMDSGFVVPMLLRIAGKFKYHCLNLCLFNCAIRFLREQAGFFPGRKNQENMGVYSCRVRFYR